MSRFLPLALLALGTSIAAPTTNLLLAQGEPHVQETDPLSPVEERARFRLPEGFTIELVASEPLIAKPINLQFDAKGRLLVTETTDYPFPQVDQPGDRLVMLADEDGDGSFESVAGEVPGLTIPIGMDSVGDDVIVYGVPNIYRASDADGDGVHETKQVLFGPLGVADTHGMQNGFVRWFDGWIYACHGFRNDSHFIATDGSEITLNSGNTYRFRPDGSRVEVVTRGQVNPFGMAFDEWGNQYTSDCHSQPLYQLIPGAWYPSFGKPHDGLGFGPTIVEHSHGSTGIAGVAFYDDDKFPEEYRGDVFIGNPITHRVNRDRIERTGASFRGQEMPDFLTCDDPWFRPVDVKLGPDGCLYVADFYNRIIGHYEVPLDHPGRDRASGRIWRISYGEPTERRQTDFTKLSLDELWSELDSSNGTRRTLATHELVDRFGDEAGRVARERFAGATDRQRMAAIWIVHRTIGIDEAFAGAAAKGTPVVRGHLTTAQRDRSEADWKSQPWIRETVLACLSDEEPMVRRLAAQALAYRPDSAWIAPLVDAYAAADAGDVYLKHALKIAIRNAQLAPGGFEAAANAIAERTPSETGDFDARRLLIETTLGAEGPDAARFLLTQARAGAVPGALVDPVAEKIGRFLPPGDEASIEAWLKSLEDAAPAAWPRTVAALARGMQMRGVALPETVATYAVRVCQERLSTGGAALAGPTLDTAVGLGWTLAPDVVGALYVSADRPVDVREKACIVFARSDASAFVERAESILLDARQPAPLRKRTAVSLATLSMPAANELLAKGLATMPYGLVHETVREMGYSAERVRFLVESMKSGRLSESLLREKDVQEGVRQSGVAEAVAYLDERLPKLPPLDQELDARIASLAGRIAGAAPSDKGAALYEQKCAKCHQLAGKGEKIGPQLDGVGHRGALRLLEDVLDPNRNVDPAFRATTFVLDDGQVRSGLVVKEEGQTITLADPEGKLSTISAGDVEQRRTSELSPMPGNWREVLSDVELVELTRFLAAQTPPTN